MGFYTDKSNKTFFPVVYVREDGVLDRQLELLRQGGWKIIEISCKKLLESSDSEEASLVVFDAIEFPYEIPSIPDDWILEYIEDLHWLDLSQGIFVVLRDYGVLFQNPKDPHYYMAEWAAKLLQSVDGDLRFYRTWNEDGDYETTPVLYGMEVSQDRLDTVLEYFEGRAIVVPDFDENDPGAEHPLYVKTKEDAIRNLKGITVD